MSNSNLSLGPFKFNFRILFGLVCLFVIASGFWTIWEPFGRDQGIHATIAFALKSGLSTYGDVYNIKPPMTTVAHFLSQVAFGHSMASIRIFDMLGVALAAITMLRVLLMFGYGVVGSIMPPLGFISVYYTLSFWTRAQTDGWAAFLGVLAVLFIVKGWHSKRAVFFIAAGLTLGVVFALKYTVAGLGLVIFAPLLARTDEARFRGADFAALVGGGLAALGLICLVLLSAGVLGDFFEIQAYVLNYVSSWRKSSFGMVELVINQLFSNPRFGALVVLGLLIMLAQLATSKRRLAPVVILIWISTGYLSVWVQGKGFNYHSLPMLLAVCAAAAPAMELIQKWFGTWLPGRWAALSMGALMIAALAMPGQLRSSAQAVVQLAEGQRPYIPSTQWERVDFSARENQEAADYLNTILAPQDTIFVWGYETALYFLTERAPRHRYPYSWPFVVNFNDGRYFDDLIARLNAQPPDYFVVQHGDATPWVTGQERDSADMLVQFIDLNAFRTNGYQQLASVGRFDVWKRNPSE